MIKNNGERIEVINKHNEEHISLKDLVKEFDSPSTKDMKYYFDSDGVIADFNKWVEKYKNEVPEGEKPNVWVAYHHYDEAFLELEECPLAQDFIDILKKEDNAFVLTSIISDRKFAREYPNEDPNEIARRVEILKENKWKWYEKRGVPRNKVIIVWSSIDKPNYCKKGDLLVDNFWKNVYIWKKKGGMGCIVNYK